MTYYILSILTGLALLLLNADYILNNKRSKKQLSKPLHYGIYFIALLNIFLASYLMVIKG